MGQKGSQLQESGRAAVCEHGRQKRILKECRRQQLYVACSRQKNAAEVEQQCLMKHSDREESMQSVENQLVYMSTA
jgi:hypothetical protein